jgi:hypothetical protein
MMGRLMGLLMLASMAIFPVSVLVAGVLVRRLGPAPFFPLAAAVLVVPILIGLTRSSWRDFGVVADEADPELAAARGA